MKHHTRECNRKLNVILQYLKGVVVHHHPYGLVLSKITSIVIGPSFLGAYKADRGKQVCRCHLVCRTKWPGSFQSKTMMGQQEGYYVVQDVVCTKISKIRSRRGCAYYRRYRAYFRTWYALRAVVCIQHAQHHGESDVSRD